MASGNAKGILFHHLDDFAKTKGGDEAYRRMVSTLESHDRDVLSQLVIVGGWYPIGTWNRALDKYLTATYPDARKGMDEFSVFLGDRELRGIVKFVLKLGSPEFLLARTSFLWNRYFDHGRFGHEEVGPRHYRLFLEASKDQNVGASRYNCAHGAAPWLTKGLELAGYPNGKVSHVKCRFDGGSRCVFDATW